MALRVDQVDDLLPRRLASCRLWAHTGENCRPAEIQDEGKEMFSTPPAGKQGIHYHIRWSNSQIDWQPFNSSAEATAMAERLARPKEIFTIEAFDDDCPRCAETRAAAAKAGHA